MSGRAKPAPILMSHRTIAALMGQTTTTVRGWIERGTFPPAHCHVGHQYFYKKADAQHFLDNGRWPLSMVKPIGG